MTLLMCWGAATHTPAVASNLAPGGNFDIRRADILPVDNKPCRCNLRLQPVGQKQMHHAQCVGLMSTQQA